MREPQSSILRAFVDKVVDESFLVRETSIISMAIGGQSFRNQSFRGPRVAGFDRSFRGRPGRVANFNGGRWHGDRHEHHRRGSRFFFASVPYYYGYYDDHGYGGDDCGWLYRRAIQTGSPYWWQRYQVCEG